MATAAMRIRVHVDADRTSAEFKQARAEINDRLRRGFLRAGERVALPEAKRRAPSTTSTRGALRPGELRASLVVRPRVRDAYLTTTLNGFKHRIVGLHEFGSSGRPLIIRPTRLALLDAKLDVLNDQAVTKAMRRARRARGGHDGHAPALRIGDGRFRAAVHQGRYRGQHFLEGAVEAKRAEIGEAVLEETMQAFDGLPHEP